MEYHGGSMKSTSINGVKIYSFVGHQRSLATWLNPKKLRALRKDQDYAQRVEVIQDLRFESATTRIKATPDGEHLVASGIYPPQVKVYELRELSLKFERHLDSEIIDFQVLADDYSKLAFLCADRSVQLHAKYGKHHSVRIPRMGRDLEYDCWSCDLLCAASSPDLYRLNLQQGRFLSPLSTRSPALNVVTRSKLHGLVACGGEDGNVECFDLRVKSSVGRISAVLPVDSDDQGVTAIAFDEDAGFQMAVGSSEGKVLIYDLRSSSPVQVKDHMYGSPILDIKWHRTLNSEQTKLITTDKHVVKIWDPNTGEGMTSIEPTGGAINDVCVFRESGLMLLALESSMIPSYFIPALGPAPKWCSSLENLTEELEDSAQATIYEDYKFLTKDDLDRLNLTNLIGTNLLRAYMHGYFINHRLYKKAKSIAYPVSYDAYNEQRKKETIAKTFANQIAPKRKLPKVNRELVFRILEAEEGRKDVTDHADKKVSKNKKKCKKSGTDILKDSRFTAMFENKDFEIDKQSVYYHDTKNQAPLIKEHFEPVKDMDDSDASMDDDSDEEGRTGKKQTRLYEVKDERHADAFLNQGSLEKEDTLPLGERVALASLRDDRQSARFLKVGPGGSREISFLTRCSSKCKDDEEEDDRRGKRRGVQSLGLKEPVSTFRGAGAGRGGGRGRGRGRRRG